MALTRRAFGMGVLGAVSAPALAQSARAQSNDVELLLVLLNDGSGSIDPEEYKLQREGTAAAIEHPRVVQSILGMRLGAIAVAYGEWGSPGAPKLILPWTRIASAADAEEFADRLVAAPREFQSYNAIGDALTMATDLIRVAPFRAQRATIDLAGDGPDMRSHTPASVARDRAVALGITINALAIQAEGSGQAMRTGPLRDFYEANVIGGPGAFVATAKDRQDFAYAIFNKLIREIS